MSRERIINLLYILAGAGLLVFIVQVWFEVFYAEIFTKILITLGAIAAFLGLIYALSAQKDEESMKKDKYTN